MSCRVEIVDVDDETKGPWMMHRVPLAGEVVVTGNGRWLVEEVEHTAWLYGDNAPPYVIARVFVTAVQEGQ